MRKEQLQTLIKNAVNLGRIEVQSIMIAGMEWISRPQARNYLKIQGIKPGMLDTWEQEGLLHGQQTGTGGTKKYRTTELQRTILTASVAAIAAVDID